MSAALIIVNPSEREYSDHRFVLSFGACSPIHLMVWGHFEDALETAAEWLADNAPGHIMLEGHGNDKRDPRLDELMAETCEEKGLVWPIPDDIDWSDSDAMQPYWDAEQDAYSGLTYTQRGYLTSYEWFITINDSDTREDVKAFIAELEARHYSDDPVVVVASS